MADSLLRNLTAATTVALTDILYETVDPSGSPVDRKVTNQILANLISVGSVSGGRLSSVSGDPCPDGPGAFTTLYWEPYVSGLIWTPDGTWWRSPALSKALGSSLVAASHYDAFAYNNAGTLTLTFGPAWSSVSARGTGAGTTELERNSTWGVLVNKVAISGGPGAGQGLYLGSFRATSTTQAWDDYQYRYLWNYFNRVPRRLQRLAETTNSWTYNSLTWQMANNNNSNVVRLLIGFQGSHVSLRAGVSFSHTSTGDGAYIGIGKSSTSAIASTCIAGKSRSGNAQAGFITATLNETPALGYFYYSWLERSHAVGTGTTYYGDDGQADIACGLSGWYDA